MIVHLSHRLVHLWMIWSQYNLCIVLHPGTPLLPLYYTCFHLCAALRRFSKALTLLTCISGVHFNGSSWAISLQSRREKLQDYNSLPEWKVNAFNRFFLRSLDAFRRGCVYFFFVFAEHWCVSVSDSCLISWLSIFFNTFETTVLHLWMLLIQFGISAYAYITTSRGINGVQCGYATIVESDCSSLHPMFLFTESYTWRIFIAWIIY